MKYNVTCSENVTLTDSLELSGTAIHNPWYEVHFDLSTPLDIASITGIPENVVFTKKEINGKEKYVSIKLTGNGVLTTDAILDAIKRIVVYLDRIMISTGQATEYTVSTTQARPKPGEGRAALVITSTKALKSDAVIIENKSIDLTEETQIGKCLNQAPYSNYAKILQYYADSKRRPEPDVKLAMLYKIAEILDPPGSRFLRLRAFRNWTQHKKLDAPKQRSVIGDALGGHYADYDSSNPVQLRLVANAALACDREIRADSELAVNLD